NGADIVWSGATICCIARLYPGFARLFKLSREFVRVWGEKYWNGADIVWSGATICCIARLYPGLARLIRLSREFVRVSRGDNCIVQFVVCSVLLLFCVG